MAITPQDTHREFAQAFNAGDIDSLTALYARDATLVPQPRKAGAFEACGPAMLDPSRDCGPGPQVTPTFLD